MGGRRYLPYAFTEHGVAMLSAVLKSKRAVQMSVLIVRAFVKLREILATHKDLATRIERIEANQDHHASVINILAEEIDNLKIPPDSPKRRIGFAATDQEGKEVGSTEDSRLSVPIDRAASTAALTPVLPICVKNKRKIDSCTISPYGL